MKTAMAKRYGHLARIRNLTQTPLYAASRCQRRSTVLLVAVLALALLPTHLRAHPMTEHQPGHVNRIVPHAAPVPKTLVLSRLPSDAEISQARVFSMPLLPIEVEAAAPRDAEAFAQENRALGDALLAYTQATELDDVSALTAFLEHHPQSRWRAGLLAHLGRLYRHSGLFQHSLDAFENAWALTKHGTDRHAQAIANRAIGELADLHTHMGHTERLRELLAELAGRKLYGPATEQWTAAVESLVHHQQQVGPQAACGIMALTHLLRQDNRQVIPALLSAYAPHDGMSLQQVQNWAQQAGLQLQMAKRQAGVPIPVPAVMHWQRGHYSAIVDRQEQDGRVQYLVENPLAQEAVWISQSVLDTETSGYFLIPEGDLPAGWQQASLLEAEGVWGKCWNGSKDKEQTGKDAVKVKPDLGCVGMAVYNFHAMLVSLNIVDTPVGYTPPLGPPVTFRVTYNQRDAFLPGMSDDFMFANLGPKWTFDLLSYVTETRNNRLGFPVTVYLRGGGQETYSSFSNVFDIP